MDGGPSGVCNRHAPNHLAKNTEVKSLLRERKQIGIAAACVVLIYGCAEDPNQGPASNGEKNSREAAQPNVLLIAVDDLNDWVGYTGAHPDTRTPNIDALAQRGTAFTQAYSQYPLCGPSRASLFAGLLPSTLGLYRHPRPDDLVVEAAEKHDTVLMHTFFRENGYKTMAAGKLMHRHVPEGSVDLSDARRSWDRMPDGNRVNFSSDGTMTDWGPFPGPEAEMSDPMTAEWAVQRLQENHEDPFLLMVGFIRPHVPWHVPQEYFDLFGDAKELTLPPYRADDLDDVSAYAQKTNTRAEMPRTPWLIRNDVWHDMVQAYLASVNFADHYVGQVLDALENSPYADNTIIVLFSDHGYLLGEKNTTQKHSLWERANKVPLIIAGPGLPKGERRAQTVGLLDIYPTLLDLANLPANPVNEGHSLKPILDDEGIDWDFPTITQYRLEDEGTDFHGQTVQSGPWRYSLYGDGSEELYNHQDDPNEWTNLAANPETREQHSELIESLKDQLPTGFFTAAL